MMSHLRAMPSDLSRSDAGHPVLLTCARRCFMLYRLFGLAESTSKQLTT
jgi:hypothetical protein